MNLTPRLIRNIHTEAKIWLRDEASFPREFFSEGLNKRRIKINSIDEYLYNVFLSVYYDCDAYVTVYDELQRTSGLIDTLALDIDGENYLEDNFNAISVLVQPLGGRIYFSGRKGFHVFFDFPDLIPLEILDRRKIVTLLEGSGFQLKDSQEPYYVDPHCLLDMARILRAPFSFHPHSSRFCIPISPKWSFKEMMHYSLYPDEINLEKETSPTKSYAFIQLVLNSTLNIEEISSSSQESKTMAVDPSKFSWIEQLLANPVEDGRHRLLWLVIAPYLINVCKYPYSRSFIIARDYFLRCNEIKPTDAIQKIDYFLSYAQRTGYLPISLTSLRIKYPDLFANVIMNILT